MRNHTDTIKKAVHFITKSEDFHAVIIEGPAGWGKTMAVCDALTELKITAQSLGSYSTALHLFSFLQENLKSVILIDDAAGVFANDLSMSILKAATWPQTNGRRIVKWGSTSKRVEASEFEFDGKLIIICNSYPTNAHALAVRSRSVCPKIDLSVAEARELIIEAGANPSRFKDKDAAAAAVEYLLRNLNEETLSSVSLRALRMVYDVILCHPADWEPFLNQVMDREIKSSDPMEILKTIAESEKNVKKQETIFEQKTGFKRRTFFKYKKQLQLSKSYSKV